MDSLVTTDWLARNLDQGDLVVLDATKHLPSVERDAQADFRAAHIPGARFLGLPDLHDPSSSESNTLPTRGQVESRLGDLGVSATDRVVLYDDSQLESAARAWFILRLYGHRRVAILDGGWAKWQAEDRPVERGEGKAVTGSYVSTPGESEVRTKAQMLANIASRAEQVIDARDAGRFTGATDDGVHGLPGGHIPGARNVFFRELFQPDGTYRSAENLRAIFADRGIDIARPLVATCGSGMTASVLLFALHLAGAEQTALYDGSWSEWGADPATPKETGEAH